MKLIKYLTYPIICGSIVVKTALEAGIEANADIFVRTHSLFLFPDKYIAL